MTIKIDFISNHPKHINQLIDWYIANWGWKYPEYKAEDWQKNIYCNTSHLPVTWLALNEDNIPCGMVSIVAHSVHDTTAAIKGLYVSVNERKKGIGSQLVKKCSKYAANLNYTNLTLTTYNAHEFYLKLGWQCIAMRNENNKTIYEMSFTLSPKPNFIPKERNSLTCNNFLFDDTKEESNMQHNLTPNF